MSRPIAAKHSRHPNHLGFLLGVRPHGDLSAHFRAACNFYIESDPADQTAAGDTALLPRLFRAVDSDRELEFLRVQGRLGSKLKEIGSFRQGSDNKIAAGIRGNLFNYSSARPFFDRDVDSGSTRPFAPGRRSERDEEKQEIASGILHRVSKLAICWTAQERGSGAGEHCDEGADGNQGPCFHVLDLVSKVSSLHSVSKWKHGICPGDSGRTPWGGRSRLRGGARTFLIGHRDVSAARLLQWKLDLVQKQRNCLGEHEVLAGEKASPLQGLNIDRGRN